MSSESIKQASSSSPESASQRLRRAALWLLFAVVLLIPKTLALRRRPRAWNVLRILVALIGAAGIAIGVAAAHAGMSKIGWIVAGGVLMLVALTILPDRTHMSAALASTGDLSAGNPRGIPVRGLSPDLIDARARALGAFVVVDGGRYRGEDGRAVEALLFVGPDQLRVLDTALSIVIEIPMGKISLLRAESTGPGDPEQNWTLRVAWESSHADFVYGGTFAEHFARVAESTVGSQLHRELPILR